VGLRDFLAAASDPKIAEALEFWQGLSPANQKKVVAYARKLKREQDQGPPP